MEDRMYMFKPRFHLLVDLRGLIITPIPAAAWILPLTIILSVLPVIIFNVRAYTLGQKR